MESAIGTRYMTQADLRAHLAGMHGWEFKKACPFSHLEAQHESDHRDAADGYSALYVDHVHRGDVFYRGEVIRHKEYAEKTWRKSLYAVDNVDATGITVHYIGENIGVPFTGESVRMTWVETMEYVSTGYVMDGAIKTRKVRDI